jgi:DNA ligase-associated metallophosphoesterase
MIAAPLHIAGERLMLCPSGVLLWPAQRLLAVADLHLEKASHHAARGHMLPPYDTRETLSRLAHALRRHGPTRVVLLGDSFHDAGGAARMAVEDAAMLARLLAPLEVTWVLGNHDPMLPDSLPGSAVESLTLGPITFRHIGGGAIGRYNEAEVSGHFHPKASMETRAGRVTRPCFLADPRRVVLPAFGAFTGGLDVRDPAMAAFAPRGGRVFLLGRDRLFSAPVGPRGGLPG